MNEEVIWHVASYVVPAAMSLLPGKMDTQEARAEILSIGRQESGFIARQQGGTKKVPGEGPAKSWWQFERKGGVEELLSDQRTSPILVPICHVLGYPDTSSASLHEAMEHNDTLACVMARLLLWIDPRSMPKESESKKGWEIYLARWRPGKPHPGTWEDNFKYAWSVMRS